MMFTGLVEGLGTIISIIKTGDGVKLSLKPDSEMELQIGESISVNGVCLTVTKIGRDIAFDISPETLRNTNLGELKVNDKVNIERALKPTDRIGGHIVTGHVDGVGIIKNKKQEGEYILYTFDAPQQVLKYLVKKGSIAVNGISLTIVNITDNSFQVAIIPHTLNVTTLGLKSIGDKVNLEADILSKYVEKFLSDRNNNIALMERLKEEGFINGKI